MVGVMLNALNAQKHTFFSLSTFPYRYVCPEPVLVN